MRPYALMSESELQAAVAEYLVWKYPDVMFHSDYGSGVKLTPRQAAMQKRQNGYRKGWPDLFIAEPSYSEDGRRWLNLKERITQWGFDETEGESFGLFIELKKEGTRLKKKNGDWANDHIAKQAEVLEKLRRRGYCAEFAVGFGEAVRIIDEYLGGDSEV